MRNFKRIENDLDNYELKRLEGCKTLFISTLIIENEEPFKSLVDIGECVKINQPILKNNDGQKILSSVSGKVINIKLKEDISKSLTYNIEIENDFQNNKINIDFKAIKTKEDLIYAVKEYGIVSKNFLIFKELEKADKILDVSCYDEPFIYNNFIILHNFFNEINFALNQLKQILNLNRINFFVNKDNKKLIKKLKTQNDKIYIKGCKKNALNLFDLYKISLLLKGEIFNFEILSLTGKALKENVVLLVKQGITLNDIIEKQGGFKQDIEQIENFKYTAMLAYNDEVVLKEKIRKCKNELDKQKLIKMLEEKKLEAKINIFDKIGDYHKKYLNCLSACFITVGNKKIATKNFNLALKNDFSGLHFLNNLQFH